MSDTAGQRTLCVVPARGGSKRVPRKNIRPVAGIPMIARTLDAITRSDVPDRVIVSTDDGEIADIARAAGAEVPFRRPPELADDHTPTAPVVEHAVRSVYEHGDEPYDYVLVVYPTAMLLNPDDLRAAQSELVRTGAELVMSVGAFPAPIERAWHRNVGGRGTMMQPEHALTRTQDLPESFFDAGQFYFGTARFWMRGGDIANAEPVLMVLDQWQAIDIDTEDDLRLAERLLGG